MPRTKSPEEEEVKLFYHDDEKECGVVQLAITDPSDDENLLLVLTSESTIDIGVVFTIDCDPEGYEDILEENEIKTLEGALIEADEESFWVLEIPAVSPSISKSTRHSTENLRVLPTPFIYRHDWGRCCCVKRGDKLEPVTPERISAGETPWWTSEYSPFQVDLISVAKDPENKSMHIILDDEHVCGNCGHSIWLVLGDKYPAVLPMVKATVSEPEPLCPERSVLEVIKWNSKASAWDMFLKDPHNHEVILDSNLPVAKASEVKLYETEKRFRAINKRQDVKMNIHTIRQAFYYAIGQAREGTWADLDLEVLRSIKGLEEIDIPAVVMDQINSGDPGKKPGSYYETTSSRVHSNYDASHLEHLVDEESSGEDDPDVPEVIEPGSNRREMPDWAKKYTNNPSPEPPHSAGQTDEELLQSAIKLRAILDAFIEKLTKKN